VSGLVFSQQTTAVGVMAAGAAIAFSNTVLAYPMFSTHSNKPLAISLLPRLGGSCGTTFASCGVQTMSLWTPPGDASIPSAS
jgi:hypothetical protein